METSDRDTDAKTTGTTTTIPKSDSPTGIFSRSSLYPASEWSGLVTSLGTGLECGRALERIE